MIFSKTQKKHFKLSEIKQNHFLVEYILSGPCF